MYGSIPLSQVIRPQAPIAVVYVDDTMLCYRVMPMKKVEPPSQGFIWETLGLLMAAGEAITGFRAASCYYVDDEIISTGL